MFTQLDQEKVSRKKKNVDQEKWINRIQNEQKRKREQELNTINQYDMNLINGLNVSYAYPRVWGDSKQILELQSEEKINNK